MALNLNDLAYPFDPTGSLASNLITGEQQILTAVNWTDYQFLVPRWAPFFYDSLVVQFTDTTGTTTTLVEGTDYYACFEFISASRACASPIWGGVQFINPLLAGVVTLQYQTLGGIWTIDEPAIAALLADRMANPRITSWEQVVDQPVMFPVIDHEWDLVDLVGASDIVTALGTIEDTLRQTGSTGLAAHLADFTNPHRVTALQVLLGNVQNFGIAQAADLAAGVSNTVYMTPGGVTTMVNAGVGAQLTAHIADTDNPHDTTPAQIGAYSIAEVNTLLQGFQAVGAIAADSNEFNGMDATTYRDWALSTGVASNSLEFDGVNSSDYAAQVLQGTANNTNNFNGNTYAQVLAAAQAGTSANTALFNNLDPQDFANWVQLNSTASNTTAFNGLSAQDFANWVQENSVASNSNLLQGFTLDQVLQQADNQNTGTFVEQIEIVQPTGLAAGEYWQELAQIVVPSASALATTYNDSHWLVTYGGAGGVAQTSAYYLYLSPKQAGPGFVSLNAVCLTPVDGGATFGWTVENIDKGLGPIPTIRVWMKYTEQLGTAAVSVISEGDNVVYVTGNTDGVEPVGITYGSADRFALASEVSQVLTSLTDQFDSLAAQITGSS